MLRVLAPKWYVLISKAKRLRRNSDFFISLGTLLRYCCWTVQHDTSEQLKVQDPVSFHQRRGSGGHCVQGSTNLRSVANGRCPGGDITRSAQRHRQTGNRRFHQSLLVLPHCPADFFLDRMGFGMEIARALVWSGNWSCRVSGDPFLFTLSFSG